MRLRTQCLVLIAYSLLIILVAWGMDLGRSPDFNGYFTKPNWLLFPLYWIVVCALVWATWDAFLEVWPTLVRTEVIQSESRRPLDDSTVEVLIAEFRSWRPKMIGAAMLTSAVANWFDISDWVVCYRSAAECTESCRVDFNLAFLASPTEHSKLATGIFTAFVYLQQYIIGVLGFLALIQILFHTFMFGYFESTRTARIHGLTLRLNRKSRMNEFGLEYWNQALNNLYWLLAIGMFIPLLSRYSQPDPAALNTGQQVLQVLVSILLLSPMLLTIVMRQRRLPRAWNELRNVPAKQSQQAYKDYEAQRLWPLDKNWASKLGIILAFLMLSYLLGTGFSELAKKMTGL